MQVDINHIKPYMITDTMNSLFLSSAVLVRTRNWSAVSSKWLDKCDQHSLYPPPGTEILEGTGNHLVTLSASTVHFIFPPV